MPRARLGEEQAALVQRLPETKTMQRVLRTGPLHPMEHAMADLSDADKRILFGENYMEAQRARAAAGQAGAPSIREAEQAQKMDNLMTWAVVFGIVSMLIVLTNYFGTAFPYNPKLEIGAGMAFVLSIILWVYARRKKGR